MIGYEAFTDGGIVWKKSQGAISPLSPPELLQELTRTQCKHLLTARGGYLLRWESKFDHLEDSSWWHIVKDRPDPLSSLKKKTRYMIRKASEVYEVRRIGVEKIEESGYDVYLRAYKRYETHERVYSKSEFCDAVRAVRDETEWWGVFEKRNQHMVGFSENYVTSGTCFYVTIWLDPQAMENFSGYLLFFEMEQHYLSERSLKYVSNGARNISHDTNVHDFLISKFNYRKAYSRLNVVYAPWLSFLIYLIYPIRKFFDVINKGWLAKIAILLRQEEIRRRSVEGVDE